MACNLFRTLLSVPTNIQKCSSRIDFNNIILANRFLNTSSVDYAARKGTRAKAQKKKIKVEVKKVGFIPHNLRGKDRIKISNANKHTDDTYKAVSTDDVYPMKYYRWTLYTPEQAVIMHKETHDPTMYNDMNAYVNAYIELNMEGVKKNRYIENFSRIAVIPHGFEREEKRTILAFCKGPELQRATLEAGATTAGGADLVKSIQDGSLKFSDYDFIIAHPNILTELVPIRGLLKRRFPNPRAGTLDPDLPLMVKKFSSGIQYKAVADEHQKNYGYIKAEVGRLTMEPSQIAENIVELLKDIDSGRPKRSGLFVTKCFVTSPPSSERFRIDPFAYISKEREGDKSKAGADEDSDEEEEKKAAASTQ